MASRMQRKPPAARRPGTSASSTRPPAGAKAPKGARLPRPSKPRQPSRLLAALRRDDVGGSLLVLAGILGGLGLWLDLAGPLGRFGGFVGGVFVGLGRHLLPLAAAGVGITLLRGQRRALPRLAVGVTLLFASLGGLTHVIGDGQRGGLDGWRRTGGALGALAGGPLSSLVGPWGAGAVLALAALASVFVIGRLSVSRVLGAIRLGTAATFRGLAAGIRRLTTLSSGPAVETIPPPAAPTRRRTRAAVEAPVVAEGTEDGHAEEPVGSGGDDLVLQSAAYAGPPRQTEQLALALPAPEARWKLPPLGLLSRRAAKPLDRNLIEKGGEALEATLKEFGVDASLVGMTVGPTVTRYEIELGPGVKVNKVTSLSHDIAYAMASPDVRIIAPIPGRSAIGVEVPNRQRQLVSLGDILDSEEAHKAAHPLEVGLGRDIAGRACTMNLATMPHLLIAGATGAGKSSCINSLITSILVRSTPEQVRMILIDPKRVELGQYNDVPHLLTPVVVNPKKAANALDWAVREMDLRYDLLSEVGFRDITGYNNAFDRGDLQPDDQTSTTFERLPFIVVVVDELADLMMVAARDVETSICRLAQMARAVGIHLVIATQRPSVDVITGVIKANVPSRLAFSVSSLADSRVILDQAGAEKLVGKGDMLLLTASSSRPIRVQGAWVEESDVHKVVAHWRRQGGESRYVEELAGDVAGTGARDGVDDEDGDDLLDEAMEMVVRSRLGSTSMLQRKLRVGFSRAGRLMDLLERKGVVGPSEGSKARTVLMTIEELEELQGRG